MYKKSQHIIELLNSLFLFCPYFCPDFDFVLFSLNMGTKRAPVEENTIYMETKVTYM